MARAGKDRADEGAAEPPSTCCDGSRASHHCLDALQNPCGQGGYRGRFLPSMVCWLFISKRNGIRIGIPIPDPSRQPHLPDRGRQKALLAVRVRLSCFLSRLLSTSRQEIAAANVHSSLIVVRRRSAVLALPPCTESVKSWNTLSSCTSRC